MHRRNGISASSRSRSTVVIAEGELPTRPRCATDCCTDRSCAQRGRTRSHTDAIACGPLEHHFDTDLAEHSQERIDAHILTFPALHFCPQSNADSGTLRRIGLCETESLSCRSEHRSEHGVGHEDFPGWREDSA